MQTNNPTYRPAKLVLYGLVLVLQNESGNPRFDLKLLQEKRCAPPG